MRTLCSESTKSLLKFTQPDSDRLRIFTQFYLHSSNMEMIGSY